MSFSTRDRVLQILRLAWLWNEHQFIIAQRTDLFGNANLEALFAIFTFFDAV